MNEVSKQATAALRLTDALEIVQGAPVDAPSYRVTLACGFTPLHVQAFLAAYLQRVLPARKVSLATGLYGDLPGTLAAAADTGAQAVAVALEWSDLDARLGFRSSGSWGPAVVPDMVSTARGALDRIGLALERIPAAIPVALCLPTLPLPPLFHTSNWQSSQAELDLRQALAGFAARAARRCSLVNSTRLAESSPEAGRFDLNSDLALGLPYTVTHASAVGEALALLLSPPAPKKGLITDLDDTLWYGLVGEVGPDAVCWDLAGHHQVHGLYQKLLAALAEEGVLVGVASKNDPLDVQQVLKRDDLLLPAEKVYPWEVHWNAKSGSVGRILRTWNIGADSVVFVDDSPMELAQVSEGHPGIECLLFPRDDNGAAYRVLRHLRDLFGKPRLSEEDSIRLQSIRQSEALREAGATESVDAFLEQAEAVVSVDFALSGDDPRVLELVNKTNQFNLNGVRFAEADWRARLSEPGAVLAAITYRDKFGPLGKIAVIQGRQKGPVLEIGVWVMSCRAFSRRIEHQCLKVLFERYQAREMVFDFAPTAKNGPLQDFFALYLGGRLSGRFRLSHEQFERACPPLYHQVAVLQTSSNHG